MSLTKMTSPDVHHSPAGYNASASLFLCPITARPCEGDLAYLCEDYAALARAACHHITMKILNTAHNKGDIRLWHKPTIRCDAS